MSEIIKDLPFISVVILNYNGKGFLEQCLASVLNSDYRNFEIILVDNASTDSSIESIEQKFGSEAKLKIIKNKKNTLFSGGNNLGIHNAKGDLIIVLNNDTEVDSNWLKEIAPVMLDKKIGAAQPKILVYGSSPVRIEYVGGTIDRYGYARGIGQGELGTGQYDSLKEIFYAAGTAMILKRSVLDEVGLFDECFGMHWEDTDLSWRIRLRGYSIVLMPRSIVYHKGSVTMTRFQTKARVAWYIRKNRIAGLIKNYTAINLARAMPILMLIYFSAFIKELVLDKDARLALSSFLAAIWNIKKLPYLLKQRRVVQGVIRCISDAEIIKFMETRCMALDILRKQVCF